MVGHVRMHVTLPPSHSHASQFSSFHQHSKQCAVRIPRNGGAPPRSIGLIECTLGTHLRTTPFHHGTLLDDGCFSTPSRLSVTDERWLANESIAHASLHLAGGVFVAKDDCSGSGSGMRPTCPPSPRLLVVWVKHADLEDQSLTQPYLHETSAQPCGPARPWRAGLILAVFLFLADCSCGLLFPSAC